MIRVAKHPVSPASLVRPGNTEYNHQDVQSQLLTDQHHKCYLCERSVGTDYQIEHLKSSHHHPALKTVWSNLFLSCGYCNGKKSNNYDGILNPSTENVEDLIVCKHDVSSKKINFTASQDTAEIRQTIQLLEKVFNGSGKIRKVREEQFYNQFLKSMNHFVSLVTNFLRDGSDDNIQAICGELQINKEFLAFKKDILKSNAQIADLFNANLIWNKA